jgi:pyrimidine deaminase RibD-like protein
VTSDLESQIQSMDDAGFMNRAVELARRGAGLVSPNPMVGAVLVSEGRIVGEGYHRFDKLKHAESYAIESAGGLARRATLYCSLEPCCHHGRTPPCTDALIEAGIARAFIACQDPDPRVGGRGISQLRSAGIAVEVGLGESQALRLNEAYFKYITRGTAFAHAVVESDVSRKGEQLDWSPSIRFLKMASEYDAIWLGSNPRLNKTIIDSSLSRDRHRTLLLIGDARSLESFANADAKIKSKEIELIVIQSDPSGDKEDAKAGRKLSSFSVRAVARPQLGSALETLRALHITSLLILPGEIDSKLAYGLGDFDKITFVTPLEKEVELDEVETSSAGDYVEITGYPRLK